MPPRRDKPCDCDCSPEIDSSPAGIGRAFVMKGNADAEIAEARRRTIRGGVSVEWLKSILPLPPNKEG